MEHHGAGTLPSRSQELYHCKSSSELAGYLLDNLALREVHISVSIPNSLPEASMNIVDLIYGVLAMDSGFTRWGFESASVSRKKNSDNTTLIFKVSYFTTLEEDNAARSAAAAIVKEMELGKKLSDRDKVEILRAFITNNWRYDKSLENFTANSTFSSGKGTCLGFALASQLILDEMGILSQTVHGKVDGIQGTHIMLLVKLGDYWHTFDPTELANDNPVPLAYLGQCFPANFSPDKEYLTSAFMANFPMGSFPAAS